MSPIIPEKSDLSTKKIISLFRSLSNKISLEIDRKRCCGGTEDTDGNFDDLSVYSFQGNKKTRNDIRKAIRLLINSNRCPETLTKDDEEYWGIFYSLRRQITHDFLYAGIYKELTHLERLVLDAIVVGPGFYNGIYSISLSDIHKEIRRRPPYIVDALCGIMDKMGDFVLLIEPPKTSPKDKMIIQVRIEKMIEHYYNNKKRSLLNA